MDIDDLNTLSKRPEVVQELLPHFTVMTLAYLFHDKEGNIPRLTVPYYAITECVVILQDELLPYLLKYRKKGMSEHQLPTTEMQQEFQRRFSAVNDLQKLRPQPLDVQVRSMPCYARVDMLKVIREAFVAEKMSFFECMALDDEYRTQMQRRMEIECNDLFGEIQKVFAKDQLAGLRIFVQLYMFVWKVVTNKKNAKATANGETSSKRAKTTRIMKLIDVIIVEFRYTPPNRMRELLASAMQQASDDEIDLTKISNDILYNDVLFYFPIPE